MSEIQNLSDIMFKDLIDEKGKLKEDVWKQFQQMTYVHYLLKKHCDSLYRLLNRFDMSDMYVGFLNGEKERVLNQKRNLERAIADFTELVEALNKINV